MEKVLEGGTSRVQVVPKIQNLQARAVEAVPNPVPVVLDRAVEAGKSSAVGTILTQNLFGQPLDGIVKNTEIIRFEVALILNYQDEA